MGVYVAGVHHLSEEISMNCGKGISTTKIKRTLQENFRKAYMCIELNAPAIIVTFLMKIRDNFKGNNAFLLWLLSSQSCEKHLNRHLIFLAVDGSHTNSYHPCIYASDVEGNQYQSHLTVLVNLLEFVNDVNVATT